MGSFFEQNASGLEGKADYIYLKLSFSFKFSADVPPELAGIQIYMNGRKA
jgi:hypothetical protein